MARIKAENELSRKEIVLQHAAGLFRKNGFRASSMRELAERIGITAPSLYNHIGSKSELLHLICFAVAEDFMAQLAGVSAEKHTAVHKLEAVIRFYIRKMAADFDRVYVANHEWKYLLPKDAGIFLQQRRDYEHSLQQIIKAGVRSGEFVNIDHRVAVLTLLSAVRGLEFWQRHNKEIDLPTLEENMINHLLRGITK